MIRSARDDYSLEHCFSDRLLGSPSPFGHPQMASSALKSRLQPGRLTSWQPQPRSPQILRHHLFQVGWSVVLDYLQRSSIPLPQLVQEGCRGSGVAFPFQFHPLHIPGLQAHRPIVADLLVAPRKGGLNQARFPFQRPRSPLFGVRTEVGLISNEDPGSGPLPPNRAAYSATKASRWVKARTSMLTRYFGVGEGKPALVKSEETTGNLCLGTKALVHEKVSSFLDRLTCRKEEVIRRCGLSSIKSGRTPPAHPNRFPAPSKCKFHFGFGLGA